MTPEEYVKKRIEQEKEVELSLLDHFAGLAMQAFEARGNYRDIARHSYDLAEAMIEERRKRYAD